MSHETFKVGEVAILVHSNVRPEYDGQECVVLDGPRDRFIWLNRERTRGEYASNRYLVQTGDGTRFSPPAERLRKRRPPQDWVKLCRLNEVPNAMEIARKALA